MTPNVLPKGPSASPVPSQCTMNTGMPVAGYSAGEEPALEIISEPDYIIEDVIDAEIMVPSGLCNFCLREADSYAWVDGDLEIRWNKRTITFNRSRLDYWSFAPRQIKTQVKKRQEPKDIPAV